MGNHVLGALDVEGEEPELIGRKAVEEVGRIHAGESGKKCDADQRNE